MAITVIGGLVTSTVLTLVVVPVLYSFAGRRRARA
jgi:Cu/Ag efflux pump CusA